MTSSTTASFAPLTEILADLLKTHRVISHPDCPFSYHLTPGGISGLVVVGGENASGKSYVCKALARYVYDEHKVEPMIASMGARVQEGMLRAFTYGQENDQATSAVSLRVCLKALGALEQRLEQGAKGAFAVLDEPDMGLSEGFAYAFGKVIAEHVNKLPKQGWGLMLVSHSRELVRGLRDHLDFTASFLATGQAQDMDHWLTHIQTHTADDLLNLTETGHQRRRKVDDILQALKEARKAQEAPAKVARQEDEGDMLEYALGDRVLLDAQGRPVFRDAEHARRALRGMRKSR